MRGRERAVAGGAVGAAQGKRWQAVRPEGAAAGEAWSVLQEWTEPHSFNVCIAPYKQFFRGYAAFTRVRWRCLVIDEMQRVRGMTERHWEAVFSLRRSDPHAPLGVLGVAGGGVRVVAQCVGAAGAFPEAL